MRELNRYCHGAAAAAVILGGLLVASATTEADSKCNESSGVHTCKNDQSAGVKNGSSDNLGTNADNVIVEDLNQNIGPALNSERSAGLQFLYDKGDSLTTLTLQYLESTYEIVINTEDYAGIEFNGTVHDGNSGDHQEFVSGDNGHGGDAGRILNLTLGSGASIVGEAVRMGGIEAVSIAGKGGKGGGSDCCSGGHGGDGGNAGDISVHGNGSIDMQKDQSSGVFIATEGGDGGNGGESGVDGHGGNGERGGNSGLVVLDTSSGWTITTRGDDSSGTYAAVVVANSGGAGGDGNDGITHGGDGGDGGAVDTLSISEGTTKDRWTLTGIGVNTPGFRLSQVGGAGGHGGHGDDDHGGQGGQGGDGGGVQFGTINATVTTTGAQSSGMFVYSKAGKGGNGGGSEFSSPGDGGSGGGGGFISLSGDWTVDTSGSQSHGIALYSLGADGGSGGNGDFSKSGAGGNTGASGTIDANITGSIATAGSGAFGLVAQSVAGHAGSGGEAIGIVSFAASGGSAGDGGTIKLTNGAAVTTLGDESSGIIAQSIGGGGGHGGSAFSEYYAAGGGGGLGGAGGPVSVTNNGALTLSGNDAHGIFAQSIGGTGGAGGNSGGMISLGGGSGAGADGGTVSITNQATIATGAPSAAPPAKGSDPTCGTGCSHGILAQSIGGGGGHGGTAGGELFSIGAKGGEGGDGAEVTVTTTSAISTTMIQSPGIMAQSVGGGGGNGGGSVAVNAAVAVAVGGGGGNGGSGGEVVVSLLDSAGITTMGHDSHAVHAHSIGGGGGNAGFAISAAAGFDFPSLAIAVGGGGGNGGASGAASIDTSGGTDLVSTAGDRANGLFAQSVGGGGGNGGLTATLSSSDVADAAVAVGGSGGTGGDAGTAAISSSRDVTTSGDNATAIIAQSLGGGGGNGGMTLSGTMSFGSAGATVAVGGAGGSAGNGNTVTVGSNGALNSFGDQSGGILAQSIGGGGGNAGMTIAGTLSSDSEFAMGVAVGSDGGKGGSGGAVTVTLDSAGIVNTSGNSVGVLAQSVGGGGGNGGITLNGNIDASGGGTQVNITMASNAGPGGNAAAVKVTNAAHVNSGLGKGPGDTGAHGIQAQSVGGGGGNGAVTGFLTVNGDTSHKLALTMSGSGAGGKGAAATINNTGPVTTFTRNSHGLFAQSVGGGGGDADGALWSLIDLVANDPTPNFESTSYMGGSTGLGSGNTGGAVLVTNIAALTTEGGWSHAIFAQSIGGGGGSSAPLGNPFIPGSSVPDVGIVWNATLALGGQSGSGGDGGAVTVTNSGGVTTSGPGAYGIFAQSIGAGGGSSGAASGLSQAQGYAGASEFTELNAVIGAVGGGSSPVSGDGGTVTVTHSAGVIETAGIGATAIYAQSVGAGGGHSGVGAIGGGGSVDVGGNGDAAGDGGDVTVLVTGGSLKAGTGSGPAGIVSAAYGIFAQSVGGGGGHAGNVSLSSTDSFASAVGLTSSNGSDSSGDGGAVTVTLDVSLQTYGDNSVGILAQSVGGGGGIQGETGDGTTAAKAGSNGGSGIPGAVSVTVNGTDLLLTNGPNSHGIWAQGAGGSGSSTTTDTQVSVNINDSVNLNAGDHGSIGVFAQSTGDGRGAVEVNVNGTNALLLGDTAIYIKDAPTSTVFNAGAIVANGTTAIQADSTTLTVTNNGFIDGNICKGTSCSPPSNNAVAAAAAPQEQITVVNRASGVIQASVLDVDLFLNQGSMVVGGPEGITRLTGDLLAEPGSRLVFDVAVDAATGLADSRLVIDGAADLHGVIEVRLSGTLVSTEPRGWELLTVAGGLAADTAERLEVAGETGVISLALEQTSQQLRVNSQVDFANPRALAAGHSDQNAIAVHLQQGFVAGGDAIQDVLNELAFIPTAAAYNAALDDFRPEVYADNQLATLFAGQRFADELMSCAQRDAPYRFIAEGQCAWMSVQARHLEQDASTDDFGFEEDTAQLAAGAQIGLGNGWFLGAGIGYEDSDIELDGGHGDSDGYRLHVGLSAKKQFGAGLLAGSVSGGQANYDISRVGSFGSATDSDQDFGFVSGQLRGAYAFEFNDWAVTPRLDLAVDYLAGDTINEQGDDALALQVEVKDNTWVSVQPAVDIVGEVKTRSGWIWRPSLTLGLTYYFDDDGPTTTARLAGSPAGAAPFETRTTLDQTYVDYAVGLEVLTNKNWNFMVAGFGRTSDHTTSYGGSLRVEIRF